MCNAGHTPATDSGSAASLSACLSRRLGAEGGVLPALRRFLFSSPSSAAAAAGSKKTAGGDTDIDASASMEAKASASSGSASFEDSVLFIVFSSNLIGILCARTIHYQFYSW